MSFTIALVSLLLAAYIVKRLCYHRFEQFAKWPQLKPSILWGHLGHIQEAVSSGPLDRHIGKSRSEGCRRLFAMSMFCFN